MIFEDRCVMLLIWKSNIGPDWTGNWHEWKPVCFQAYATVVSAAEGNDPDSDNFGKVDEVKQYPSALLYVCHVFPIMHHDLTSRLSTIQIWEMLFLSLSSSARFIRAVSELEFLGFIKSTRQKTDHVARLTWGGCWPNGQEETKSVCGCRLATFKLLSILTWICVSVCIFPL